VRVGYPVTTTETAAETRLAGRVGDAPAVSIPARTSNAGISIQPAQRRASNRPSPRAPSAESLLVTPTPERRRGAELAVLFALCPSSSVRTLVSWGVFGALERTARERGLIDQTTGS
jgi:hypothetical protein